MGNSKDTDPFPVVPDTDEYDALSFLLRNREERFTPSEVATCTNSSEASMAEAMTYLFEEGLIEQSEEAYYVDPDRADRLTQRLKSIDSVVQIFESAPTDDAYAEEGWEEELPSIDQADSREESSTHD